MNRTMRQFLLGKKLLQSYRYLNTTPEQTARFERQKGELMKSFPQLIKDIVTENPTYKPYPYVKNRLKQVVEYMLPKGGLNRPLLLINAFESLKDTAPVALTQQQIFLVCWCIELENNNFVISDDLLDNSPMRRGEISWYTFPGVGASVLYDVQLFDASIMVVLRKYFGTHPEYANILDAFRMAIQYTAIGQLEDIRQQTFADFTWKHYNDLVYAKTTAISYVLPITVSCHLGGVATPENFHELSRVLARLGRFFQTRNDLKDYRIPEFRGIANDGTKQKNDIRNGRNTWFVVTFLESATPEQIELFKKNYGVDTDEAEDVIHKLYLDTNMPQRFDEFSRNERDAITAMILKLSEKRLHGPLIVLIEEETLKLLSLL